MPWFDLFIKTGTTSAVDRARALAAQQRAALENKRRADDLKGKAPSTISDFGKVPDTSIERRPIGVRSGGGDWGMCWLYRQEINLIPPENRATHYRVTCFSAEGLSAATIDRTTQSKRQFWQDYYLLPVSGDTFLVLLVESAGDDIVSYQVADRGFYVTPSSVFVVPIAQGLQDAFMAFYEDPGYGYRDVSWWRSDVSGAGPYPPIALFQNASPDKSYPVYGDPSIYTSMDSPGIRSTEALTASYFGAPSLYRASHDLRSLFIVNPSGDTVEGEAKYARFLRLPSQQALDPTGNQRLLMVDKASIEPGTTLIWAPSAITYRVKQARDPKDYAEEVGAIGSYTLEGDLAWQSSIIRQGGSYWICLPYSGDKYATIIHWYETILPNGNPGPLGRYDPPRCINIQEATGNARWETPVQQTAIDRYQYSTGYFAHCFCTGWGKDWTAKLATYGQVFS